MANEITSMIYNGKWANIPEQWWYSDEETPLTDQGEQEARQLKQFIVTQDWGNTLVVASPFVRARRTAEIIYPTHNIVVCQELRERSYGNIDDYKKSCDLAHLRKELQASVSSPYHRPFGGESFVETVERVRPAVHELIALASKDGHDTIVFAVHGEVVRSIRAVMHNIAAEQYQQHFSHGSLPNCLVDEYLDQQWRTICPPYADIPEFAPFP